MITLRFSCAGCNHCVDVEIDVSDVLSLYDIEFANAIPDGWGVKNGRVQCPTCFDAVKVMRSGVVFA